MESILLSIKKLLGISEDYDYFDEDLLIHINSVFAILSQLGVGPPFGFVVHDEDDVWTDFIGESQQLEFVKSYVGLKVKLLFDPPLSAAVIESTNRMINEFEWRILVAAESEKEVRTVNE